MPTTTSANFYLRHELPEHPLRQPGDGKLLAEEKASTDDGQRARQAFDQIQQIGAEDAPTIPIWQADQVAAVRDGVHGFEDTFDPSFIFRFWLLSKDRLMPKMSARGGRRCGTPAASAP